MKIVNLFWTGGWDSTFRLLQLLVVQKRNVQPHYIIDPDRRSTTMELRTMRKIKDHLFIKHPDTQNLLLPTQYRKVCDIKPDQTINESFERLCKHHILGSQYNWMARLCEETEIQNIELTIHKDDRSQKAIHDLVILSQQQNDSFWMMDPKFKHTDEYILFHYFRFPVLYLTKINMEQIAKNKSFNELMELTWFCHRPWLFDLPCGLCFPCMSTIEEGLGRRLPLVSRMHYTLRLAHRIKRLLKKFPAIYAKVKRMQRKIRSR